MRKNKLPSMPKPVNGEGGEGGVRRAIIFGLLAQPIFYGATRGFVAPPERQSIEVDTGSPFEDGDAVTSPALEIELVERMRDGEGALAQLGRGPRGARRLADLRPLRAADGCCRGWVGGRGYGRTRWKRASSAAPRGRSSRRAGRRTSK